MGEDPILLEALYETLSYYKFSVRITTDTVNILRTIRTFGPDLFLLDLNIYDKKRRSMCSQLRSDVRIKELPIIITSSYNKLIEKSGEFEFAEIVAKPFDLSDLLERIKTITANSSLSNRIKNFWPNSKEIKTKSQNSIALV